MIPVNAFDQLVATLTTPTYRYFPNRSGKTTFLRAYLQEKGPATTTELAQLVGCAPSDVYALLARDIKSGKLVYTEGKVSVVNTFD
jgi:hypothetical protein